MYHYLCIATLLVGVFASTTTSAEILYGPANNLTAADILNEFWRETGGPQGYWVNNWNLTDPVCFRFGVYCDLVNNTVVEVVSLSYNGLVGTIPSSFGYLSTLQELYIDDNALTGTIPETFGNLTDLSFAYMSNNFFNGSVPESLSNLYFLFYLDVSNNSLSGTIPPALCAYSIAMSYNQLTGPLPNFAYYCSFIGLITLDHNQLSGCIPEDWSALTGLTSLVLSSNLFNCSLPESIGAMTSMVRFTLSSNQFVSPLPQSISNWKHLKFFYVDYNNFSEPLPLQLHNASGLTELDLTNNAFTGDLSVFWSQNWTNIQLVYLGFNNISGAIPSNIGTFKKLQQLYLGYNQVHGPLPDFANNDLLQILDLSYNPLNVTMTSMAIALQNSNDLSVLKAHSAMVHGDFSDLIYFFYTLFFLDLSRNNITGQISGRITKLNFMYLDLSNNALEGSIPDNMDTLPLETLFLEGNHFRHNNNYLPSFVQLDTNSYVSYPSEGYSCPSLKGKRRPINVELDPSYYDYVYCTCNTGYHGVNGSCSSCPNGAICAGGQDLLIPSGYYPFPSPQDPVLLAPCQKFDISDTSCNPTNDLQYVCADGYFGRYCATCEQGYFRSSNQCRKCDSGQFWTTLIFSIVIVFAVIMLSVKSSILFGATQNSAFQITVTYLQMISLLKYTQIPWASYMTSLFGFQQAISSFSTDGLECIFNTNDPLDILVVKFVAPILVLLAAVSVSMFVGNGTKRSIGLGIFFLNICMFYYTMICISYWTCESDPLDNELWLSVYPNVKCWSSEHKSLFTLSIFGFILYTLIPLTINIALLTQVVSPYVKSLRSDKGKTDELAEVDQPKTEWLNWLFMPFTYRMYWWSLILTARKLIVAIVIGSLTSTRTLILPVIMAFVIVLSCFLQALVSPFRHNVNNWLELTSLCILLVTYFGSLSLLLGNTGTDPNSPLFTAVSLLLLVLNIFMMIVLTFAVVRSYGTQIYPVVRKQLARSTIISRRMSTGNIKPVVEMDAPRSAHLQPNAGNHANTGRPLSVQLATATHDTPAGHSDFSDDSV